MTITAEFPVKLQPLFEPWRYKVSYGGRGAARSWSFARALLLMAASKKLAIMCAREHQRSIAESVHKLLSNQIELLGLEDKFEIQRDKIIGLQTGSTFVFEGIKSNPGKVKSYEGIDICWIEEANKVSKTSWEILIPTIRKAGSEIWMTFNPDLDTDYTFVRFVVNAPENAFVVKMTWADNPWFTDVLRAEKDHLKKVDYDAYLNVWEGHCRQMLEGAVFAKELRAAQEQGRICKVTCSREVPVDTFWDLGRRDLTAIWFAQRVGLEWRVLEYFEDCGEDITYYLRQLQSRGYLYGTAYLPHDAKQQTIKAKRSIEQLVRDAGYRTVVVPRTAKKANAINAARVIFSNCYFDEAGTKEGLNRLKKYTYAVVDGVRSEEPLHDDNSNGADAFMTLAQAMKGSRKQQDLSEFTKKIRNKFIEKAPGLGWMG